MEIMNEDIDKILDQVVNDCGMVYSPAEFQRVAVNALGSLRNVILISPTGSGKMNVPLLATLVLRKILNKPKGVCIITQPLTCIMKQKLKNDVCSAAMLSMSGQLSTSSEDGDDASLSCPLKELLEGEKVALFGHGESFETKLGRFILRELMIRDMLILIGVDEFHQGGHGHWESFRPSMMSSSASLRY